MQHRVHSIHLSSVVSVSFLCIFHLTKHVCVLYPLYPAQMTSSAVKVWRQLRVPSCGAGAGRLVLVLVPVTPPDPGHDPRTESQNSLPNKSRHLTVSWTALTHRENEPGGLSHSVKLQEYNSPAILSYWPGATSDSASIRICDRFTLCKLFFWA